MIIKYTLAKLAEAPILIKNHIEKNGEKLKFRRPYFRIKKYVDNFLLGEKLGNIENRLIILPGLRGVGKTTLVFQIYDYLKNVKKIDQSRLLYFSADELKICTDNKIIDVINTFIQDIHQTTAINLDENLFIFVDEAHFDNDWAQAAKIMFDKSKKIFLIFTGSSALNLELNVDIARRALKETIFPMNFSEYITFKYNIFPPAHTAESIKQLLFAPDDFSLKDAQNKENELIKTTLSIGKPVEKELMSFLCCNGFPFGLTTEPIETHQKLFNVVERIVEKDIFSIQSFNTDTKDTISRIIVFLALQKPGGTSDSKLAQRLETSPTLIRTILEVLEKSHLIFSIKPYGGAGKTVRKPWKYYFLSPSINAAIRSKLGAYNTTDRDMLGTLAENLVAATFFRMKETTNIPTGIFYDSNKGGVDFLLKDINNNIIPIEVGIGKKNKKQIKNAIKNYKSKYGFVICNIEKITKKDNIIFIPLTTFSFS
ncbi:MAG: ATP-binding protein [Candidatus Diapherotrites archaeon]|nr:ATP-binding protein [Candidatus Diapherotrites archaeon]